MYQFKDDLTDLLESLKKKHTKLQKMDLKETEFIGDRRIHLRLRLPPLKKETIVELVNCKYLLALKLKICIFPGLPHTVVFS